MKKNIFKIIRIFLLVLCFLLSLILLLKLNELRFIPIKYISIIFIVLLFINIVNGIFLYLNNTFANIIGLILSLIIFGGSLTIISHENNVLRFLNSSFNNYNVEVTKYNIVVLKDSSYESINDLVNKKIGYLKDDEGLEKLKYIVKISEEKYEDVLELYNNLINNKVDAILLNEAYIDIIEEEKDDFENVIRIIYTFDIEDEIDILENNVEYELKPLNIYISGSDSRTGNIVNKSRSDVNMIVTINPYIKKILLTSIPRDYYVQVYGQTGLKDKLTHAGIYGIDVSSKTIENLFDIKIDYSIKLGFGSVVEIVDLIGGIDVYSDKTFTSSHIKNWTVYEGMNHFNGEQALAYSRERYAYISGDRHRIINQQQILEATLQKIMSDKTILLKYDKLLKSLSDLYRTDISKEVFAMFIKEQLDKMSTWSFESISVNGSDANLATYTAPNSKRYVMIPYEDDVKNASYKIKELYTKK